MEKSFHGNLQNAHWNKFQRFDWNYYEWDRLGNKIADFTQILHLWREPINITRHSLDVQINPHNIFIFWQGLYPNIDITVSVHAEKTVADEGQSWHWTLGNV